MKKLLLLFCALLCLGGSRAWANVTRTLYFCSASSAGTSSEFVKSFTYANSGNWSTTATSKTSVPVTLTTSVANKLSGWDGAIRANESFNLTISVPEGYKIASYSFGTQTHKAGAQCTFTAGGNTATATSTSGSNAESILSQSELDVQSVTIAVANTGKVDNECKAYMKNFTVTVSATSLPAVLPEGVYQIYYNDVQCLTSTAGKNQKEGGVYTTNGKGDFKLTVRNAASGTYYVQELASGNYLYTDKVNSVSEKRLHQNVLSLVADKSDKDAGCTWIIEQYGPYFRLIPSENTEIAIGVWSSDNDNYWSFLEKEYSLGQLIFTNRPLSSLLDTYTIKALVDNGGFDFNTQIKSLYSTYFLSVEQQANLGNLGYPTSAGYSTFTSAFTSTATSTPASLVAALEATIAYPTTGYYYIKNKGTNTYMFRDEGFDTYGEHMTLLNTESRNAKYIWYVDVDGSTINVTSLTGKKISSGRDATERQDMTLTSAYEKKFTDGFGAFYMGYLQDPNQDGKYTAKGGSETYASATNPRVVTYYEGDEDAPKAYWLFEAVDESDYDVYSTSFENAPSDDYINYAGSSSTGNNKVFTGGKYFMTKGASVNASDFTANYSGLVTLTDHTITVTYSTEAIKTIILDYISDNNVRSKVAMAGSLGWPKDGPTCNSGYLKTLLTIFDNEKLTDAEKYTAEYYNMLESIFESYLATTDEDIVKPTAGYFYRIKGVSSEKYMSSTSYPKASGTYRLKNSSTADASTIFYLDVNKLLSYDTGFYTYATCEPGSISNNANASTYTFDYKGTFGEFGITGSGTGGNGYLYSWKDSHDCFDRNGTTYANECRMIVEEVTSLPVTISAAGYATLKAPVALTIPAKVKAYYISSLTSTEATLTEISTKIPANTPVILQADADTYNFAITTSSAFDGTNKLSGTIAAEAFETGQIYTLQRNVADTQTGLFPKAAGTLAGFKAYLLASEIPSGASAKGFTFKFEDVDGISTVQGSGLMVNGSKIFNLAGQRMSRVQKGVNIVNGKKVLVK